MPITVETIFNTFNINKIYKVNWNECIHDTNQGVYLISSSSSLNENLGLNEKPVFNELELQNWIYKLGNFLIDNKKPTLSSLKSRLTEFWLPDENILYIGKANKRNNNSGLGVRIHEYYETEIGERGPHSGGQWIKALNNLESLFIYYGYCDFPKKIEIKMLEYFMSNVSSETKSKLRDKKLPLPFANIRYKPKNDKDHGMKYQRKSV